MSIKIGPSEGNSGALIRWGRCWDNGVWINWKYGIGPIKFRLMRGYLKIWRLCVRWGN